MDRTPCTVYLLSRLTAPRVQNIFLEYKLPNVKTIRYAKLVKIFEFFFRCENLSIFCLYSLCG